MCTLTPFFSYHFTSFLGTFAFDGTIRFSGKANFKLSDNEKENCIGPSSNPVKIKKTKRKWHNIFSSTVSGEIAYGEKRTVKESTKITQYVLYTVLDVEMTLEDKTYLWNENLCRCVERNAEIKATGELILNNAGLVVSAFVLEQALSALPDLGKIALPAGRLIPEVLPALL